MYNLLNNVFYISRIVECMEIDGTIVVEDERELFYWVLEIAKKFEKDFHNDEDYLIAIEEFTRQNVLNEWKPTTKEG